MKMNLRVTYGDGSGADVTVSAPDIVAFEETFDRSAARFDREVKFTDICWLAWHRLTRSGLTEDFKTWMNNVEGVEIAEVADPVPLERKAHTSQ